MQLPHEDHRSKAPPSKSHACTHAGAPSGWQLVAFTIPTLAVWLVNPILSLVDTAVVGLQCSTDLAALAPGTMLIDYTSYIFTFLSVACERRCLHGISHAEHSMLLLCQLAFC